MIYFYSQGKIKFKNGDKFKGRFKDGRPSGYGEMRYMASIVGINDEFEMAEYKGMWKSGKRHG